MAKPIDLLAPFREAEKAARFSRRRSSMAGVEAIVKGKLLVDLEVAERLAIELASVLKQETVAEIESGSLGSVDQATLERRQRTIRRKDGRFRTRTLRDQQRYPAGYQPNPNSRVFGIDSGLLRDSVQAREEGKARGASISIHRSRQKAGYVRRIRVLDPRTREYRTAQERVINGMLKEVVRTKPGRLPGVRRPKRR